MDINKEGLFSSMLRCFSPGGGGDGRVRIKARRRKTRGEKKLRRFNKRTLSCTRGMDTAGF